MLPREFVNKVGMAEKKEGRGGGGGPFLLSPPLSSPFFCFRFNFRAENLATQAVPMGGSYGYTYQ